MADATIRSDAGLVRLTFAIEGYERVSVGLSRWARQIRDFRPFWRQYVAPWFFAALVKHFHNQGILVGGWRPLSPRYAAWKARRYPGKTILRRTDRLIRSLTWSGGVVVQGAGYGGSVGPEGVFLAEETGAAFGTRVPYAHAHHYGAGRLPQRRILHLPPGASRTLGRMLHRWAHAQATALGVTSSSPTPVSSGPGGGLL